MTCGQREGSEFIMISFCWSQNEWCKEPSCACNSVYVMLHNSRQNIIASHRVLLTSLSVLTGNTKVGVSNAMLVFVVYLFRKV